MAVKEADSIGYRCWRWLRRSGDCDFGSKCSEVPRIPYSHKGKHKPSEIAGGAADIGLHSWVSHLLAGL